VVVEAGACTTEKERGLELRSGTEERRIGRRLAW
jgi:hypothetical protein